MNNLLIDNHKLYLHPDRVAEWLRNPQCVFPLYVEISPVGYCNHRCKFCALDFLEYAHTSLDSSTALQLLTTLSECGVRSVMFAGEGEPLLYPHISSLVHYSRAVGLDTALTTNGVAFTQSKLSMLRELSWVKVSVDAGDDSAYSVVHGCSKCDFTTVIRNIEAMCAYKRKHSLDCTIGVQALAIKESIHSLPVLQALCKSVGADYLVIKQYSKHSSSLNSHESVAVDSALFDPDYTIIRKPAEPREYSLCPSTPYFWAYITSTGDVYGCSDKLGDSAFCYGNINETNFKSVWLGERRARAIHYMSGYHTIACRPGCRMDCANKYLDRLVNPQRHDTFI